MSAGRALSPFASGCLLALVASPASATSSASAQGARVLALEAANDGWRVRPAAVELECAPIALGADSALDYRCLAREGQAARAGIELVFDDGSAELANALDTPPEADGWRAVHVSLAAHAGRKLAHARLVADGLAFGTHAFYFDAPSVSAGEERTPLYDLAPLEGGPWRRDEASAAVALLVDGRGALPAQLAPAERASVHEPWAALELSTLRRREGRAAALFDGSLPRGLAWSPSGAPLAFAEGDDPPRVPAAGQRISLAPVDGGRFYEVHVALATRAGEGFDSIWRWIGGSGESRESTLRLPAIDERGRAVLEPGQATPGDGFVVLEIPVASAFSIDALELPSDERIDVLAISAHWRPEALEDAHFRRAWLASERRDAGIKRFLADIERAPEARGAEEVAHERKLVELLLAYDVENADILLRRRMRALGESAASSRGGAIALVPELPALHLPLDRERAAALAVEHERARLAALERDPELRLTAPDARTLTLVAEREPKLVEALRARVAEGRIDPSPVAWTHGEWGLVGEEALVRQLVFGIRGARRALGTSGVIAWAPHDLAWNGALGALAARLGFQAFASAPIDIAASARAPIARWTSPGGSALPLLTPARAASSSLLDFGALDQLLDRAEPAQGERSVWTTFDAASDAAVARANRAAIAERAASSFGARVRTATLKQLVEEARSAKSLPSIDAASGTDVDSSARCRSDQVHAWAARAEARLVDAQTWIALASADGLLASASEVERLWERVLDVHAALAAGGEDAAALAEARAIVERCDALAKEALLVLARGADTSGLGASLIVFNPLAQERTDLVEVQDGAFEVVDAADHPLASQSTHEGTRAIRVELPSLGYEVVRLVPRDLAQLAPAAIANPARVVEGERADASAAQPQSVTLANGRIRLTVDARTGAIAVRSDSASASQRAADTVVAFEAAERGGEFAEGELDQLETVERGPLRAVVRCRVVYPSAVVRHVVVLRAASDTIEISTDVEGRTAGAWRVRMNASEAGAARRAVPFGIAGLAAHGDVAAHGWVAAAGSDAVALVAPDVATCAAGDGGVTLVLDERNAPSGRYGTRWAIHAASSSAPSNWTAAALELAHPVSVLPVAAHEGARPARHSFLRVVHTAADGRILRDRRHGAVLTSFARAEEGDGWTLRLADASGSGGSYLLELDRPIFDARRVDLLEQKLGDLRVDTERAAGSRVEVRLAPWGIETLRISPRPAR